MNEKTLKLLEFDAIRGRVAQNAMSEEAAYKITEELPRTNYEEVAKLKAQVLEILNCINAGNEKRESLPSIAFLFPKLEVEGTILEIDEAFALGLFVERGENLKNWLFKENIKNTDEVNPLETLFSQMPNCQSIAQEVFRVIDKEGNLRDLPEFREIKKRIRNLTKDLENTIARYANSDDTRHILQTTIPSQRDGRAVLAVKANFRGRIKGIVHEVSSTGQTLFIEPTDVVERNNDILIEKRKLDAEILRIIREMTKKISEKKEDLKKFHEKIIFLETIRSKARYAYETKGHFAHTPQHQSIILEKARHPLLGYKAVPIDFSMNKDTKTVIITGPNTGGKTVTLKTVGLFALMNQFGLALPAEEGTTLPIFDGIYADIGDEQSLSQSLSTFSAHMTNISAIAKVATENSLVLLDELGSGTDPQEGSAIAMAILDYLIEKNVSLITTTHHGILKNYGYTKERVENASVEFDSKTLSPTYKIILGIPGESRAIDIASRNGMLPEIISNARSYLEEERSDVSALITGLKIKHQELNTAEELQKNEEKRLREERRKTDLKELRLRQKEAELKAQATGKLWKLLEESRKTLENLVREVREGELTREKTLKVKEFLNQLEENAHLQDELLKTEHQILEEDMKRFETETLSLTEKTQNITAGMEVFAGTYNKTGTVIRSDKKGFWIVEIGAVRMTFSEKDLRPIIPSRNAKKPIITITDISSKVTPQFEISLRGMRLEEALSALQKQLDSAVLSGMHEFSVIHGKGDGILQNGVHEFLKKQSQVANYYFSRPELGGFGRTEVILK